MRRANGAQHRAQPQSAPILTGFSGRWTADSQHERCLPSAPNRGDKYLTGSVNRLAVIY